MRITKTTLLIFATLLGLAFNQEIIPNDQEKVKSAINTCITSIFKTSSKFSNSMNRNLELAISELGSVGTKCAFQLSQVYALEKECTRETQKLLFLGDRVR